MDWESSSSTVSVAAEEIRMKYIFSILVFCFLGLGVAAAFLFGERQLKSPPYLISIEITNGKAAMTFAEVMPSHRAKIKGIARSPGYSVSYKLNKLEVLSSEGNVIASAVPIAGFDRFAVTLQSELPCIIHVFAGTQPVSEGLWLYTPSGRSDLVVDVVNGRASIYSQP